MKKLGIIAVVVVVLALVLPVSNLFTDRTPDPELLARAHDPELADAMPVLMTSCTDCHTTNTHKPIYMKLPVAKGLIQRHTAAAIARFDMDRELFLEDGSTPQAALAKVAQALDDGNMPPASYAAMHWNASINAKKQATLSNWIRHSRARANGAEDLDDPRFARAVLPLEAPAGLDPAKVELGRQMYHDTRLSGDDSISCASCHDLSKGGTDQAQYSTGVGGQLGGINAPTTFNAAYNVAQFWDGRAPDLAAQADGPPNNPIEMASSWEQILGKLSRDKAVVAAFDTAYGGLSAEAVRDAIATYEQTLVTTNSPFDRYLLGDDSALTDIQKAGWTIFDARGCDTCHAGPAMGNTSFELLGLTGDYFADRGTDLSDADVGRRHVTGDEHDAHHFKVPTLRNVTLSFPYFHDGTVVTLEEAVRKMCTYQRGIELNDDEVQQVTAFLESLTGELDGTSL